MNGRDTLTTALETGRWTGVNRELLAKMIEEFLYEELLEPTERESDGDREDGEWTQYRLDYDDVAYRFEAMSRPFDSYRVELESIERKEDSEWTDATDAVQFLLDARESLGVAPETASHLVREYNNTLLADAHIDARKSGVEKSILDMDYPEIEGEMEGHPWFTINKGRIGFGYDDYRSYAPELKNPQSLVWVAVHRAVADFRSVDGLDYESLLDQQLGDTTAEFADRLRNQGHDPASYYYLPVHEWQWNNTVSQLFADEIATDAIVPLGTGPNTYLPQQSVRTLTNVSDPEKPHVKVPIRVLNTIVYRGLPGTQALEAPRVTEYVKSIRDGDSFLRDDCNLVLPGEIASINYDHPKFSQLEDAPYQYHELLGAVWRESVESLVEDDEQVLPLSALMHEDTDGRPIVSKLAERAGCSVDEWLSECFDVLLPPLLQYLYKYGLVFMPHGTNTMLILRDGVPTRLAIKDYVDEIAVSEVWLPELDRLPDGLYEHDEIIHQRPPEGMCQHIVGTLFVCVLRYVADLLNRREGYEERKLWRHVRATIEEYQSKFPELEARFDLFDLFKPEYEKLCLNRNRLVEYGYSDDHAPPEVESYGTVSNALADIEPTIQTGPTNE
ncbi:siderophore biosynthesis protein [Haloferax mucosum ATCC BAA-1512]|uniref:Siderophore biosynthesis protein n=1 Tax=Haloferax mucosum ATCC BAA-1512 TaxID=662479 RepID=M0IJ48_9EURY|nr:IucA/IucC family siderophore biosynthesis protein [Haloferax mucosum]ELZ95888.1 siderophore biosynthesis protein [Haloferax mucosum ATCC BAA-1512]